ncbi:MAG: redox-regulated ATPase YchF [Anaerolineae bacterium]
MQIGIFGLPGSGQTTVFNALTHGQAQTGAAGAGQREANLATVAVPDGRVDKLSALFKPRKTVFAQVQYLDVAGSVPGTAMEGTTFNRQVFGKLALSDALLAIVRAFPNDDVFHPIGDVNPARDLRILEDELILWDLSMVEKRRERLKAELSKPNLAKGERDVRVAEDGALERIQAALESDQMVRNVELTADEEKGLRSFQFLSAKPLLVVVNLGEGQEMPAVQPRGPQARVLGLRGEIEAEIAQLEGEEAAVFLAEYGIEEPGLNRVIRASYDLLGVQSFFTVGEDEVRAWTVPVGATAVEAAGAIHTDLARGFIRAEVVHYDDLLSAGSLAAARTKGTLRLEGKDYIVKDGDIVHIRFNI